MSTSLQLLSTLADLDAALARSADRPAVIFKHSPTCGTSAQAHESIAELLEGSPVEADWYVVPVQSSREVSNAIAARFGVRHESPQALIVDAGHLAWHGSHFRVTGAALQAALERLRLATSARESVSR
jgi:bacillithiol system protein YtxJ